MRSFLAAVAGLTLFTGGACAQVINGGGSSFINPLMSRWTTEYQKKTGTKINYASVGSGTGKKNFEAKNYEFGCTDALFLTDAAHQADIKAGKVQYVPLVMGAIVPIYNLPGVENLRLTGEVLADIFMCKVTMWNDPAVAALNPGASLPAKKIVVVRRADGSGSTFIFSFYLSVSNKEWATKMKAGNTLTWPETTVGQKGTEGVAGEVQKTEGAIGYVELNHAVQSKIPFAAVKNRDGEFVKGSTEGVTAAAAAVMKGKFRDDFHFGLINQPGKDSYPIAGATWAMFDKSAGNAKLTDFFKWCVGPEAQKMAAEMEYAPLPDAMVKKVLGSL